jgi:hypothetical protein
MVDDERSTIEETLVQMRNAELGMRNQGLGRIVECGNRNVECGNRNVECGNLLPLCRTQPPAELELSPRRYHVFARAAEPAVSTIGQTPPDQLWTYIAPIHRKRDAIAVSAGLVESGLAVEVQVGVIAQSPGPRAGKLLIIHREHREPSSSVPRSAFRLPSS